METTYEDIVKEKKLRNQTRWIYYLSSTVLISIGIFYSNFAPMLSLWYWIGLGLVFCGAAVSYRGFTREGL